MKIEEVREEKDSVSVVTTGATFSVQKNREMGEITVCQGLEQKRLLATIQLDIPFSNLTVLKTDTESCILFQTVKGAHYLRLEISRDSVLSLYSCCELTVTYQGNFLPEYSVSKEGNALFIDEEGGIGIYPCKGMKQLKTICFSQEDWVVEYQMDRYCEILTSIFPPRPYEFERANKEGIVHYASIDEPYPSDRQVEEYGRYGSILVVHQSIWHGRLTLEGKTPEDIAESKFDAGCSTYDFMPVHEEELRRVIKKAHSLGMKVIPYMSPRYSCARGDVFLDKMAQALDRYHFDGVYYDGLPFDIPESYGLVRKTRGILKDRLLYLHRSNSPLKDEDLFCPFIDTYADYTLMIEQELFFEKHLRYAVSGYNTSNTIGFLCYQCLSLPKMKDLLERKDTLHIHFSYQVGNRWGKGWEEKLALVKSNSAEHERG